MNSSLFFNITTIAYFAAMVLFIVYIVSRIQAVALTATGVVWGGFVANTIAIGLRWREAYALGFQQAPLSNLYESVVFFAWCIALVYLLMDLKYKQRALGAFVIPFAFIFMIWGQLGLNAEIQPLVPALQSNWLTYHVITCFLGYAGFAVACGASIMYLLVIGREERKGNNQGLISEQHLAFVIEGAAADPDQSPGNGCGGADGGDLQRESR